MKSFIDCPLDMGKHTREMNPLLDTIMTIVMQFKMS